MEFKSHPARRIASAFFIAASIILLSFDAWAQSNVTVRIMAANISSGTQQAYEAPGIRIFQGLKPDVVAIQEFNYAGKTTEEMRAFVDTAFGTNYSYYRESGSFQIPNGIISRYPILTNGSWGDDEQSQPNRGFAWAQIDLPGTNDLYVVSVHLLTRDAATRNSEATAIKSNIAKFFPTGSWVIVAGDCNASTRTEAAITTFKTFLYDGPTVSTWPTDLTSGGNPNTNAGRDNPYDYVFPSFSFTNHQIPVIIGANSFPSGLVFDSTVFFNNYTLNAVSPVQSGDSHVSGMQHMAVVKDFSIPVDGTGTINPPAITGQPQSQGIATGNSVTFSVTATGTAPLAYQWLFNGTDISGATTNPLTLANVQLTDAGNYSVTITNLAGTSTSSNAVLVVTNAAPSINSQPQNQSIVAGQNATFSVTAEGTLPLNYQWRLGGMNISSATTNPFVLTNVQATNAGDYSVIITNIAGSVTSSVATLTILVTNPVVFAQWNFNSSPADANTATGLTSPSIGSGIASLAGGIAGSFVGGDAALDPAPTADNTAWTTTTYPASTANNKTAGVQFKTSTVGMQNIVVSWSQRSSNTGGKYFRLQYSTNGINFMDFPAAMTVTTGFTAFTNSLTSIPGVNNNSNFVFRIVAEFESTAASTANASYVAASTTYATTGTTRFDMVTVSGTSIPPNSTPAAPAVLSAPVFSIGQFQMLVTGTAGSNYVVQATTNLAPANWIGQFTNSSPFIFTDADLTAPQKFYRAIVQP
ncbi:MAG: immunoglobulin domain-containing protein [Limisphaerales bacterium]